jgi:hypothetical protein
MLVNQKTEMDTWQLDFEWLRIRHFVKDSLGSKDLPDLKVILFLIGVQELGSYEGGKKFTKEEKQDLMHVAVCALLEEDGYYRFKGRDQDGWPHWEVEKPFSINGVKEQEHILKEKIIKYFDK